MAMAELIHEIEDPFNHLPPAPPPSPEAQRTTTALFDGTLTGPLNLCRDDFADLDQILQQTRMTSRNALFTVPERSSQSYNPPDEDSDEDEFGFPASPKKRMCNSPCSFPEGYNIQNSDTYASAKFTSSSVPHSNSKHRHRSPIHSRRSPVHSRSPPLLTVPKLNDSPPLAKSPQQTSPHSIPLSENGLRVGSCQPTHGFNTSFSPPRQMGMLSKSFDLHNVQAFEEIADPNLPKVRPMRAYTAGASNQEEKVTRPRTRKLSLKRTKDERDRDSDLQFSFEYSYTSTGSSDDTSDWLVVTPDPTTNLPLGKKACPVPLPASTTSFPLNFANSNYMDPSLASSLPPVHQNSIHQPIISSVFNPPVPMDQQPPSLVSMESVQMMDTSDSLKLDSIDSMECGSEQLHSYVGMDMQSDNPPASHYHDPHSIFTPPTTLRSHSSENHYAPSRHSYIQNTNESTEQDLSSNISRSL